jgi:hypothetical protein
LTPPSVCAGGYLDADSGTEKRFRPFPFAQAGMNLNRCPGAGAYFEFRRSWQTGLELRSWLPRGESAYDGSPEADIHLRKVWLAAEERASLRNSEYVDLALGVFPSYRNDGNRAGLQGHARITIGKYWTPLAEMPWGFDIGLSLGRYFVGHPPGFSHPDIITASLAIFYAFNPGASEKNQE